MTIRCGYADISAGQIHYREARGSARQADCGEPLLLLHPAPRSSRVFVPLLEQLRGFHAIAVDLPGFGASCPLPAGSTMASIAGLMAEFIAAKGIDRAHVFGLHSGNKVAAALAAEWPQSVDHLIIAGMRHSIVPDGEARNEAMRRYLSSKPPLAPDDDPEAYAELMMDKLACQQAYDALYEANYRFDLAASLARVRAPALIIELAVAEEDSLGSPGAELARRISNATVERFNCNDRDLLKYRCSELADTLSNFSA